MSSLPEENKKLNSDILDKCGLHTDKGELFGPMYVLGSTSSPSKRNQLKNTLNNITQRKLEFHQNLVDGTFQTIGFCNKNDFTVDETLLGMTNKKRCFRYYDDYEVTVTCASRSGVPSGTYRTVDCEKIPPAVSDWGYYVVGIMQAVERLNALKANEDLKKAGFCD